MRTNRCQKAALSSVGPMFGQRARTPPFLQTPPAMQRVWAARARNGGQRHGCTGRQVMISPSAHLGPILACLLLFRRWGSGKRFAFVLHPILAPGSSSTSWCASRKRSRVRELFFVPAMTGIGRLQHKQALRTACYLELL